MKIFASKRTTFALIVLGAATILAVMGVLTGDQWTDLAKLLTTSVVMAHTVSHVAETIRQPPPQIPPATAREGAP